MITKFRDPNPLIKFLLVLNIIQLNRNVSSSFTQFDLKVAVKRFGVTLNYAFCVLSSHTIQPDTTT